MDSEYASADRLPALARWASWSLGWLLGESIAFGGLRSAVVFANYNGTETWLAKQMSNLLLVGVSLDKMDCSVRT